MALDSMLHADEAVLVVIDVQERLSSTMARREQLLDAAEKLVGAFGVFGCPVISTRQNPRGLGDTESRLLAAFSTARHEGDEVVVADKMAFDCFGEPAFREALERAGRQQLVIAGMETHICVTQTALSALREGYDVHVVADACCSRSDGAHAIALDRLRAAGCVVTMWESAAYELAGVAGTDQFRSLLRIVKGEVR
jgi:nicotinamidase-related amidase